jgi:DNA invertase Pin-like site-specific DNA recombinase
MAGIMLYTAAPESEGTLGGLVSLGRRDRLGGLIDQALEAASNGSARHREMLGQALADARLGRFEVMLVWALDRVSREGVEATLAILRRFAGHGTAVWSLKEPWTETADPRMAELLASLYAWMAAEESRRRSERTRAGLKRRKREGLPVGRQPGATDKKPRRPVRFSRPAGVLLRFDRAAAGPAILPGRGQGDLQPAAGHVRCGRVCE